MALVFVGQIKCFKLNQAQKLVPENLNFFQSQKNIFSS